MHIEDKFMGTRVGITVLILVGLMVVLIFAANLMG